MNHVRALITGGAGGIGSAIAREILDAGGAVLLADANEDALQRLAAGPLAGYGDRVGTHRVNLADASERAGLCAAARAWRSGINVLVNCAGVNHFRLLTDQSAEQVDLAVAVNVTAPLQLTRELLPHLLEQPAAQVLNIGSVFGAIGYPGYAVYSATKFAIRGFSEALRRELADTTVQVHYLAPRATRTGINPPNVEAMNVELGVATDTVETVAAAARRMLERERPEAVVGWPEKLFARLNGALPRLVDGALRKQLPVIIRHARPVETRVAGRVAPVPAGSIAGRPS